MLRIISKFTRELVKPIQIKTEVICEIENITNETIININETHILISWNPGKNKIFENIEQEINLTQINRNTSNLKKDFEDLEFSQFFEIALEPTNRNSLAALNNTNELSVFRFSLEKKKVACGPNLQEITEIYVLANHEIKNSNIKNVKLFKFTVSQQPLI